MLQIFNMGPIGSLAFVVVTAGVAASAAMTEAAATHCDWLRDRGQNYGEQVRARLLQGPVISGVAYLRALQLRAALLGQFAAPFSFLGLPAFAEPIGFSKTGLPLPMQSVGRPLAERRLREIGTAYKDAARVRRRLPQLRAQSPATTLERGPA